MSRSRSISTEISSDERLGPLGEENPLAVMLYALAIPHADDWGRLKGDATAFRYEVAPFLLIPASQIDTLLEKIAEAGLWTRYEVGGRKYIAFPRDAWFKHQSYINAEKRTYDGSKLPSPPGEEWQSWEARPSATRTTAAKHQETPRNTKDRQETPKNPTSPSPSPSPTPSLSSPPTEEGDAREVLPHGSDTQAGAVFPPESPLPVMVQDFLRTKAGADAPKWEEELRLNLAGRPLTGPPGAYMMGVLRSWARMGGPPAPPAPKARGGYVRDTPKTRFEASQAKHAQRLREDLAALQSLPDAPRGAS